MYESPTNRTEDGEATYRTNTDAEELARAVLGEVLAEMSAPASAGRPVEHAYRLRGPGGNKAHVTEPSALKAFEIGAWRTWRPGVDV